MEIENIENNKNENDLNHKKTLTIIGSKSNTDVELIDDGTDEKDGHSNEVKKLEIELDEISPLYLPNQYLDLPETFDTTNAGKTYITLSHKEEKCLEFVDNFMRQYKLLLKDRKNLLLAPENEYKVRKFISTFIKPTKIKYKDFYEWDTSAKFISDYLDFVPLIPCNEIPVRVLSSSMVLNIRRGTCFEYSHLLCSILLGSGYDAYVVSGYATRECCLMDQSRIPCPFLDDKNENIQEIKNFEITKYLVKPPKDLKSKFEIYQEAMKIQQNLLENEKRMLEEEEKIKEKEKLPPDPLSGLRVHCWILIKSPLRDVKNDFFIEPLTGQFVPLNTDIFNGIECIWNHLNVWINMQDCSNGIQKMKYDLKDKLKWEWVLPTEICHSLPSKNGENDDEEIKIYHNNKFLNIINAPPSWISKISISLKDYEKRFPNNEKKTIYYKVKCVRYSVYFNSDGLTMVLSLYKDISLKELIEENKIYENRLDKLYSIKTKDEWTIEYFHQGNSFNLKEHHYRTKYPYPESDRIILFHHIQSIDCLVKKEETPLSLKEYYVDRPDHLIYLECTFSRRIFPLKKEERSYRNIDKIVKRYRRNHDIPCNEDVAEMILFLSEDRIFITYHIDEFNLIPNTREYFKPTILQDGKNTIPFYSDTHYLFQADETCKKSEKKLKIYQYLTELFGQEKKIKDIIRWSENQTKSILHQRQIDKENPILISSLYDTMRNSLASKKRIDLEAYSLTEKNKKLEDELDYLAPYIYSLNINEIHSQEEAFKVREDCLTNYRDRIITRANLIQSKRDEEMSILVKKQQWFYQRQTELMEKDEEEYVEFCKKTSFKINNLENVLTRYKQTGPRKYIELDRRIRGDLRLKKYLNAL